MPSECQLPEETKQDREFRIFHRENPNVYLELVKLSRTMTALGHRRIGIRMIWETMRYNHMITTNDPFSEWKLNDHYHSRYARLIMTNETDLKGIFETRSLKS